MGQPRLTDAQRKLVEDNIRLATYWAAQYKHRARQWGIPWMDLVQEANVGLIDAASRFDPGRRTKFSAYAKGFILARIRGAFDQLGHKPARREHDPEPIPPENLLHGPGGTVVVNWESPAVRDVVDAAIVRGDLTLVEWRALMLRRGADGGEISSQTEVAVAMSVSVATVRRWERTAAEKVYRLLNA